MRKTITLKLTGRERTRLLELNLAACRLYNEILQLRQEALARGDKPSVSRAWVRAHRGSLAESTAIEILNAVRRANAAGNFSRRLPQRFFPLAWRKGDFLIRGTRLLLSNDRIIPIEANELVEGAKRVVIAQNWQTGEFLLFMDY